jgi:hypothetical protein
MGMALVDGALYVVTGNSTADPNSDMMVTLAPTVSVPLSSYWSSAASAGESFTNTPSALRVSSGSNKLWVISNNTDELFYYTDILAAEGPALTSPADGKAIQMNPITGKSYDVSFVWEQPPKGREYTYDLWIAFDSSFKERAKSAQKTTSSSAPALIVGPSGAETLEYMAGQTYYWKVRVAQNGPLKSPWSEVRSFTIEPGEALVPTVLAPANGGTGISRMPSFSWAPIGGATDYQFKLADNVALGSPIVDVTVKATGYSVTTELDYGKTYYWAVKPIAPVEGAWSAIANFTVKEEAVAPAPPVVVKEVPPPVINIPAPPAPPPDIVIPPAPAPPAQIAPAYIWAVIIIGAVLVIAVIILIVRTRRAV